MYLVDTSAWIAHFKMTNSKVVHLLLDGKVITHEFILGELSLGQFSVNARTKIFERLLCLERVDTSSHEEVLNFVLRHKLAGKGIGWIDCHLLHASHMMKIPLLTLDKNLGKLAKQFSP